MARVTQRQQCKKLVRQTWQRTSILALAAAGGMLAFSNTAFATSYSWLGVVNNNWGEAGNWSSSDPLNFPPPPPLTPALGDVTDLVWGGAFGFNITSTQNVGPIDVNSMVFNATFNAATLGISGSSTGDQFINLGAGGIVGNVPEVAGAGTVAFASGANRKIVLTADQTWSNTNTIAIISVRRLVEGNFKVTKTGAGTIELQGINTSWTGGLQIDEGFIRGSASSNAFGAGPITINTANNVGFSASGSVSQTITGPMTLGGAGSVGFRGSNAFFLENTVTLLSDKTVSTPQPVTVNGTIGGNFVMTKSSSGAMTLNVANSHGGFIVDGGNLVYGSDDRLGAAGAPVGLSGGTLAPTAAIASVRDVALSESGGTIDGAANDLSFANADGQGVLVKQGTGVLTVNRVRATSGDGGVTPGGLNVAAGSVVIAPGASVGEPARVSNVEALTLAGGVAPTTTLNITNNGLVVDYSVAPVPEVEPFDTIRAQIISAYAGGAWTGPGITSSLANASTYAVGYGEASAVFQSFPADFMGQQVDATAVLVRYTRYGDANLDGTVNSDDFNRLATSFGLAGNWTGGDFNYDGFINSDDFNLLAGNFGLNAGIDGVGPDDWSALAAAVPEPTMLLTGLAASAAMLLRRRRA
jgi:autotransporter-associated beta strand protein